MPHQATVGDAVLSPCKRYRYVLRRGWDPAKKGVVFVGLNPSTADASTDDPTLRRCVGFAKAWGFGSLVMLNLFAFRATDPADLLRRRDPVGPENDAWIAKIVAEHNTVIACWGNHGRHRSRDTHVARLIGTCRCIALTQSGQPAHPLYLRSGLKPKKFRV